MNLRPDHPLRAAAIVLAWCFFTWALYVHSLLSLLLVLLGLALYVLALAVERSE